MTRGLARISSGVPSAMRSPWSSTVIRSLMPMTTRMSCSMSRIGEPELGAQPADEARHLLGLVGVHARRGLVQQQQHRLAGQRAGDLQPALVAVGQVAWRRRSSPAGEADERQELARAHPGGLLLARPPRRRDRRRRSGCCLSLMCMPDEHVLERGHVLEQTDVLEGSSDARLDHVVRTRAPEHTQPMRAGASYQGGRTMPISRLTIRTRRARWWRPGAASRHSSGAGRSAAASSTRSAMTAGRNQTNGSIHARSGRATIRRPRNSISPVGRVEDARDDVEERGLARAVRPDEADDRARGMTRSALVDGDQATEALGDGSACSRTGAASPEACWRSRRRHGRLMPRHRGPAGPRVRTLDVGSSRLVP